MGNNKMIHWLLMAKSIAAIYTCSQYQCASSGVLTSGTCIGISSNVYYLSTCSDYSLTYCPVEFTIYNISCTVPPAATGTSYPGEACSGNSDCVYNRCFQGYCAGQNYGGTCRDNSECNPGYRCDPGLKRCTTLFNSNVSGCVNDYDCQTNMGCDYNQCRPYFSVDNGDWVNNCTNSVSNICKSGQCLYGRCIAALKSSSATPMLCGGPYDCYTSDLASEGITLYTNCTCGYGSQGNSYCYLFPGDKEYSNMLSYMKEWLSMNVSQNCNTLRRWNRECVLSYASTSFALNYDYAVFTGANYPLIQDMQDCAVNLIFNSYYQDISYINSESLWIMLGVITIIYY